MSPEPRWSVITGHAGATLAGNGIRMSQLSGPLGTPHGRPWHSCWRSGHLSLNLRGWLHRPPRMSTFRERGFTVSPRVPTSTDKRGARS